MNIGFGIPKLFFYIRQVHNECLWNFFGEHLPLNNRLGGSGTTIAFNC